MKKFQTPEVDVIRFEIEDVIATRVTAPTETPGGPIETPEDSV